MIHIWCDGAIRGNPGGIGGTAAVLLYRVRPDLISVLEVGCSEEDTTNNRMEMRGPLLGMTRVTKPVPVTVYSDSQYVVLGMSQYMAKWKKNGAMKGKPNADLWNVLDETVKTHPAPVEWRWVRGHNKVYWNERADEIAGVMVREHCRLGKTVTHERRYTVVVKPEYEIGKFDNERNA